jgi:hypothetical protein
MTEFNQRVEVGRQALHCRSAARKHGAYAAEVYSARAYLRVIDAVLTRLEMAGPAAEHTRKAQQFKSSPISL